MIINSLKAKVYDSPIVTTLEPFTKFYKAGKYHQNYYQNKESTLLNGYSTQIKFEKVFVNRLKRNKTKTVNIVYGFIL